MELVNFTKCKILKKGYGGKNGNKHCRVYNDELYMVKFPVLATKNKNIHYSNSIISEYIGCKIFKEIGFDTQEVLLVECEDNEGKSKICVACKDFEKDDFKFQEFAFVKNKNTSSSSNGYGVELSDVIDTINKQNDYDPIELKKFFWEMFIVDALIGNLDRHNGNWGFLYDVKNDKNVLAPIFDCGSCLYPQIDKEKIREVLEGGVALEERIYQFPFSALNINNNHINYFDFISSLENKDCNNALVEILPKINIRRINDIIDEINILDDEYKNFYKFIINERKKRILDCAYNKLRNK